VPWVRLVGARANRQRRTKYRGPTDGDLAATAEFLGETEFKRTAPSEEQKVCLFSGARMGW